MLSGAIDRAFIAIDHTFNSGKQSVSDQLPEINFQAVNKDKLVWFGKQRIIGKQ